MWTGETTHFPTTSEPSRAALGAAGYATHSRDCFRAQPTPESGGEGDERHLKSEQGHGRTSAAPSPTRAAAAAGKATHMPPYLELSRA